MSHLLREGRVRHLALVTLPPCGVAGWSRVEQQKDGGGGGGRMAHHLSRAGSVVLQQAGGLRRGSGAREDREPGGRRQRDRGLRRTG